VLSVEPVTLRGYPAVIFVLIRLAAQLSGGKLGFARLLNAGLCAADHTAEKELRGMLSQADCFTAAS
jgi:hypothetical protein